jgi:phosphoenolpyruvate---glycerone phosphotransferase subunit DhaL
MTINYPLTQIMIKNTDITSWLRSYGAQIEARADELNRLDGAQGDGDFGASMLRGVQGVAAKLDGVADKDIGTILKTVAMTLISSMGGTSGPLLGTLFLQMANKASASNALSLEQWTEALEAGINGIMARGKAQVGDKTMIDALMPALDALKANSNAELSAALAASAAAAQAGAEHTATISATKGRASYVGERSIGHIDPGALNIAILLSELKV